MKHVGKLGALLIAGFLGTSATAALAQAVVNPGNHELPQGQLHVRQSEANHGVNHHQLRDQIHNQQAQRQQQKERAGVNARDKQRALMHDQTIEAMSPNLNGLSLRSVTPQPPGRHAAGGNIEGAVREIQRW